MAAAAGPEGPGGLPPRPGLDLRPGRGRGRSRRPAARAQHPPIGLDEYDQRELLRLEKETLGTFLSSHPLAEVARRAARRVWTARSRRSASKADGSFVTVGGIVSEFKRHKTKRGDPMAFATLDDVEGQVEMLVLGKAYMESTEFLTRTRSWSSRAGSTTRSAGRRSSSSRRSSASSRPRTRWRSARKARADGPIEVPIRRVGLRPDADRRAQAVFESNPGRVRGGAGDDDARGDTAPSLRRRLPRAPLGGARRRARRRDPNRRPSRLIH